MDCDLQTNTDSSVLRFQLTRAKTLAHHQQVLNMPQPVSPCRQALLSRQVQQCAQLTVNGNLHDSEKIASDIQPCACFDSGGSNRMNIALAQHDVILTTDFNFVAIIWAK